jgi:hypothetical protein
MEVVKMKMFKTAYSFYVVQLLLQCNDDYELNKMLDNIIDNDEKHISDHVEGDDDLKKIFEYVYDYRRFNRTLIQDKPNIKTKTLIKVFIKSLI